MSVVLKNWISQWHLLSIDNTQGLISVSPRWDREGGRALSGTILAFEGEGLLGRGLAATIWWLDTTRLHDSSWHGCLLLFNRSHPIQASMVRVRASEEGLGNLDANHQFAIEVHYMALCRSCTFSLSRLMGLLWGQKEEENDISCFGRKAEYNWSK